MRVARVDDVRPLHSRPADGAIKVDLAVEDVGAAMEQVEDDVSVNRNGVAPLDRVEAWTEPAWDAVPVPRRAAVDGDTRRGGGVEGPAKTFQSAALYVAPERHALFGVPV